MKKRFFSLLICVALLVTMLPQIATSINAAFESGTLDGLFYVYDTTQKVLTISGSGPMTDMSNYGYPWTHHQAEVKELRIEGNVTVIRKFAFDKFTALEKVSLCDGLQTIEYGAFRNCSKLKEIIIPDSVDVIGNCVFQECYELSSVTFPQSVKSLGQNVLSFCFALKSVTLPQGITTVPLGTFYRCDNLESVTFPECITALGEFAFNECNGLETLIIPENIVEIAGNAFLDCKNLTDLFIINPECVISKVTDTLGDDAQVTIHGYANSSAQTYADAYGYAFEVIPCKEGMHKYETTEYTAPSCEGQGHIKQECVYCGTILENDIPANGHSYDNVETVAATCTTGGYDKFTCSACGNYYLANVVAELGHDWDEGSVTSQPTETEEGIKTFTCFRCGATRTESVPALGHTHSYTATVTPPTCTENGYTTYTCACGDSYITDYVGALGHNFVGGVCTRCGEDDPNCNPPTPVDPCEGYTDINRDGWYHSAADFVISRSIMGSTKTDDLTFEPNTACTRSMIVSILYRLSGSPKVTYEAKFPDVKAGQWYSDAVIWAYQNGIVSGYSDGRFGPNDKITREQMAVILKGYADFKGIDTSKIADLSDFPDANKVTWSKAAIRWAVAEGLISGKASNGKTILDPRGNATRAEVASILMRFVENILEA